MSKEMWSRLQEASSYQKKALRCLLPEECRPHVEKIEEEVSAIGKIMLKDMIMSQMGKEKSPFKEEKQTSENAEKRKKGKIDIQ